MKNLSEATEGSFKCDIIDNLIRNSDPGIWISYMVEVVIW